MDFSQKTGQTVVYSVISLTLKLLNQLLIVLTKPLFSFLFKKKPHCHFKVRISCKRESCWYRWRNTLFFMTYRVCLLQACPDSNDSFLFALALFRTTSAFRLKAVFLCNGGAKGKKELLYVTVMRVSACRPVVTESINAAVDSLIKLWWLSADWSPECSLFSPFFLN